MFNRFLWPVIAAIFAAGCTTGAYLKPVATSGTYSTENPSCGGNLEVLEFSPEKQNWISLRVYARQNQAKGTVLMVSFRLKQWTDISEHGALFASDLDKQKASERVLEKYTVTTSKNSVTVEMQGGNFKEVPIQNLESPHQLMQRDFTFWPPPTQIDPGLVDDFSIIFPEIFVNGERLFVPPIRFKKDPGGKADLILNC